MPKQSHYCNLGITTSKNVGIKKMHMHAYKTIGFMVDITYNDDENL